MFAAHVGETCEQLCTWLMGASLYQARNPHTINPFRKDQESQVTETDGTACRNFFTILNIGKYEQDCSRRCKYIQSINIEKIIQTL